MTVKRSVAVACVLIALMVGQCPAAAGAWLLGSVSIRDDAGQRRYGEYISIFLTHTAIPIPHDPDLSGLTRYRRIDRINQLHLDFFKIFSSYRSRPGYLVAHTDTSETGNFAFLDVPPGDYQVVVTFPAMIDGYKVAWQVPVTVVAGRIRHVTLDDGNLALPMNRRE